jgi:hypothetical protein
MIRHMETIEMPTPKPILEQENKLISMAKELETVKGREAFSKLVGPFLQELESSLNVTLNDDVLAAYREMEDNHMLLRVENTSRILRTLTHHVPLSVGNENDHYANSVVPNHEGIKIAFSEGKAPGPVRLLFGFDLRTAISYESESLHVYPIDDIEGDLRDASLRKQVCRHVSGEIQPEHIRHMVLRVPRSFFPQDKMTDEEKKTEGMYIFRSINLPKEKKL